MSETKDLDSTAIIVVIFTLVMTIDVIMITVINLMIMRFMSCITIPRGYGDYDYFLSVMWCRLQNGSSW